MMIVVYVVCSSVEEARLIGKTLVEEGVAACVNILPQMESIYKWEEKLVQDKEVVLLIKTVKGNYSNVESKVLEMHSYDCPAVFELKIGEVNSNYLNWIKGELK